MNEKIATQEIKAKTKDSPFKVYLRESLGFLFWAYILIKIFVLDIDLFIETSEKLIDFN